MAGQRGGRMSPFGVVCEKCGSGMPMGVQFCGSCGASIERETASPKVEAPPVKKRGGRALLIGWGLGLLGGLMLGLAFPSATHPPPDEPALQETGSAATLLSRAHDASEAKEFSKAVDLYRRAAVRDSANLSILVDLGIAQLATGDKATARASFKAALSGPTPHPAAAYNLARLEEGAGNMKRARVYYARYLKLDPDGNAAAEAKTKLGEGGGP